MSGTKEGAEKAKQTILDKYGPDFYKNSGKIGGMVRSPKKGFGGNRELARIAGMKGGRISRRKKAE